jgi:hypothetical protein
MNAKSAIEKLQIIVKEEETQKSEHKQRQEEETKLLKKKKTREKLRRVESIGMLNIQQLAIRLLPHSPSSSKCGKGKVYNEKMQFMHMTIQDIYRTRTSTVEFLYIRKRG